MGRHKGSGEGSIFKSGNLWRGQISIDGERKSVSAKTKKEVVDKLAEIRFKYNHGDYVKRNDVTVEEWCNHWLYTRIEPAIKEQSFLRLEALFVNHIYAKLGDTKIQHLTKEHIEKAYAEIFFQKSGKNYKEKTYSHSTVNALSVQFKKCLQYAVDNGVLAKNPHNGVSLHKLRPPKKVNAYTCADQEKIILYCKSTRRLNEKIFYFLISTGMRFGEAVALTWDDVDLSNGCVAINKTGVSIHGSMTIQERPKTEAGVRTIFIGQNITEWLKQHKKDLDEEANYRNLVFPNTRYNIINQANAILNWQKITDKIGVEYRGIHALRHTWATRALENGIDVQVVSKMLGHKNIITTMNIYQDVLDDEKKKAACTLDALF